LVKCAISVIRAIAVMHYKGLSHFLWNSQLFTVAQLLIL
jgi:hypothetical protein